MKRSKMKISKLARKRSKEKMAMNMRQGRKGGRR